MDPLVSICMPTRNGSRFIREALESALNQTYTNVEIVVSDDSSADNTLETVKEYRKAASVPIYIYQHDPAGIGANWNHCIEQANGKYIKFLFQDDVLYPECITEMINVFKTYSNVALVASKRDFIIEKSIEGSLIDHWTKIYGNLQSTLNLNLDDNVSILDSSLFSSPEFRRSPLNKIGEPSAFMFHKSVYYDIAPFDETFEQILDYVFCYKILKRHPIAIIHRPLVRFRLHSEQTTNRNRGKHLSDYESYQELMYKDFYSLLHPAHKRKLYDMFSRSKRLRRWIRKYLLRPFCK